MVSFTTRLRRLDLYRSLPADLVERSLTGGIVSICSILFIAYLFFTELQTYLSTRTLSTMTIDSDAADIQDGHATLQINLNITLYRLPCALASVDVEDVMGGHLVDIGGKLHKYRTDSEGKRKLDENGLSLLGEIGPHSAQVGEGCNVVGTLIVKRVPGNFHISSHAHTDLLSEFHPTGEMQNVSHTIHWLYFGAVDPQHLEHLNEAVIDPLAGTLQSAQLTAPEDNNHIFSVSYEYFIRIVPTSHTNLNQDRKRFYQYVANRGDSTAAYRLSSIYFRYDLSPIAVEFKEVKAENFGHFVVQCCAIIGGVFTVLGLINSLILEGTKRVKQSIGKQT